MKVGGKFSEKVKLWINETNHGHAGHPI